jgi:hypothetical protein
MSRHTLSKEELELNLLREREQQLLKREKESAANRERIVQERGERERTMPPLEEVRERERRIQHEQWVSRGEVVNIQRAQNRSVLLLLLLITATCTLVWWGIKLMQGGG